MLRNNIKMISILYLFLLQIYGRHVYYQRMLDGTFMIAASQQISKSTDELKGELEKIFLLPKHQAINLKQYPKLQDQVNIGASKDKQALIKLQNVCLNGKANLSIKQKLEQFKIGPCSPLIIVPGILATSLQITIDCQKLQKYENGKIFSDCGWDSCSSIGINKPDKHYILWVGVQLTLKVTQGFTKCFGDIFGLVSNKNYFVSQIGKKQVESAGIKTTWLGNSNYSRPISKCGVNAIRDLSGFFSVFSLVESQCALNGYSRLLDMLEVMGYLPGINLQPLPYDFRYGISASQTQKLFPQIIKNLYLMTGKKVVVVAHSLGTLHSLSALAFQMGLEQRQKMVRHFIAIAPPWTGTISAIRNLLYGDPSYFTNQNIKFGIDRFAQRRFAQSSGSNYDLFIRDTFKRFRNQDWMKQILQRIQYEQKRHQFSKPMTKTNEDLQIGEQNVPLDWFPSKQELCFNPAFKKDPFCQTGFIDFQKQPIFIIEGKQYYGNTEGIKKLLQQNMSEEQAKQSLAFLQQTKIDGKSLDQIPNPGVETSIIFTTLFETQTFYDFSEKPKAKTLSDEEFIKPQNIRYSPGDLSVPSFSPLVFAAKWIHEVKDDSQPIHVIQYCGSYQGKSKYYSTLSCQCLQNPLKNAIRCTHPCILGDKYLISLILGIATNRSHGYSDEKIEQAIDFSVQELIRIQQQCINLHLNNNLHKQTK